VLLFIMDGSGEKRPKPPGAGNFGAPRYHAVLGELRNVGIVFQKQHAVDVKDFGNFLAPRQGMAAGAKLWIVGIR
jgi:hypothetical protein